MTRGVSNSFAEWSDKMRQRMDVLGMTPQVVIPEQAGLFARTMINIAGPRNLSAAEKQIEHKADGKFASFPVGSGDEIKAGHGSVHWLLSKPGSLLGVPAESDKRDASVQEIEQMFRESFLKGTRVAGHRGKQAIRLFVKPVVDPSKLAEFIAKVKSHLGRLKASWVPAWQDLKAPPGGLGPVPAWVLRHADSTRSQRYGFLESDLHNPHDPSVTIVNRAKGVEGVVENGQMRTAIQIRIKAMVEDTLLYVRGIKKIIK